MRVTILPSVACGTVSAPPSKSMAHRALICGALSRESTISNVAYSQDIEATLHCLASMGAIVDRRGNSVCIGGLNPFAIPEGVVLDCGESGSTLRFLLPLCLLSQRPVVLTGSQRLMERPLNVYEEICREQGLLFERESNRITVCGPLRAGKYAVTGNISSQFITGLLFALSLLDEKSVVEIVEPFESESYVTMTLAMLSAFGVKVIRDGLQFIVKGKGVFDSQEYTVEGDYSNAAFLDGFNLLGGDVKVLCLSQESVQGDGIYKSFYRQFTCKTRAFDLSDCPDLGPVMFALAAACGGAIFSGTARLRIKESDRVASMVTELAKFGVYAVVGENTVEIQAGDLKPPTQMLNAHNDHRIAMALSLLCSVVGGTIEGAESVAKSYPDYFDILRRLSIDVRIDD